MHQQWPALPDAHSYPDHLAELGRSECACKHRNGQSKALQCGVTLILQVHYTVTIKPGMNCSLHTAELLLSIWTEQCEFQQLMAESANLICAVFQAYCAVYTWQSACIICCLQNATGVPGTVLWAYLKETSQPEAYDPELTIIQANLLLT